MSNRRIYMQIANLMTPEPVTIGPTEPLAAAKLLMDEGRFRRLPVVDDGRLVGILTERDLREHLGYLESTLVDAAMRTTLVTITPYETVDDAARLMLKHKIGGLPVVTNGRLTGIVTATDLLRAFLTALQSTRQIMKE
ncbi:MAG TPA: CBS domain-containing protein [Candidatus Binataceae bacterium]|nr:CBS domain-containing protein [Candidatus Binataceae bacterium]